MAKIKPTIGIVGYGAFSKFMIKELSPYFHIVVCSRQKISDKNSLDFTPTDIQTVLAQTIIIPSIPSQFLESFFKQNKKFLNPNALVIDVCSVKIRPAEVLKRVLPKTTRILATHPMFGPASAKNGLKGQPIFIHPVRISKKDYRTIKVFLADKLELKVIEGSLEEHDKMMAYAQGLSHYIGRAMQLMSIPENSISTKAYSDLLDMKRIQGGDSLELFESIMFDNPFAVEVNKEFKRTVKRLDKQLGL